jgi:hypothetical protein
MALSAVALFCDDIREERLGTLTLVGVMPDNVEVPAFPGALAKVGIYVRIHLDPNTDPGAIELLLTFTDGVQHKIGELPKELVDKSRADALAGGNPIAGLIANLSASPFPVPQAGRALVSLKYGDETQVVGGLNFSSPKQS